MIYFVNLYANLTTITVIKISNYKFKKTIWFVLKKMGTQKPVVLLTTVTVNRTSRLYCRSDSNLYFW